MAALFVASVRSEWLKTKRSLTTWVVVGAACFVPAIVLLIRLTRPASLPALYRTTDFWTRLWISMWESMALMVLPLTIIVLVSLVTQIEYRNNTWKQLHASPQPLGRIFFAKLVVIFALVVELFACFNVAIYLAGDAAGLDARAMSMRRPLRYPVGYFLWRNVSFFLDALPVVGPAISAGAAIPELRHSAGRGARSLDRGSRRPAVGVQLRDPIQLSGDRLHAGRPLACQPRPTCQYPSPRGGLVRGAHGCRVRALRDAQRSRLIQEALTSHVARRTRHVARGTSHRTSHIAHRTSHVMALL